jgi:hypothetical protein
MAETTYYVSKEPFEEFVKSIEERFDHAEERAGQRFLSLEKRMEQGFAYMEQARAQETSPISNRASTGDLTISTSRCWISEPRCDRCAAGWCDSTA